MVIANLPFDFKPIASDYSFNKYVISLKDVNHELLKRFMRDVKTKLAKGGKLVLAFSDTIGCRKTLNMAITGNNLQILHEYKTVINTPTLKNPQKRNTYNCIIINELAD